MILLSNLSELPLQIIAKIQSSLVQFIKKFEELYGNQFYNLNKFCKYKRSNLEILKVIWYILLIGV